MAQFPLDAAHILALADAMIAGFKDNHAVFPSPPIPWSALKNLRDAAAASLEEQTAAQAAAKVATEHKTADFAALGDAMKNGIAYAEFTVKTPAELSLIGWGPKADPTPLTPPGQPLVLEIAHQDAESLELDWKKPRTGGKAAFYRAEMRTVNPAGEWTLKGTATSTKIELTDLPHGTQMEFRIIAENAAGQGMPSNTVTAVV